MPETSMPILLQSMPLDYLLKIEKHLQSINGNLILGVIEKEDGKIFNSAISLGVSESQNYRKHHLVPFGEYVPLRGIFGFICMRIY